MRLPAGRRIGAGGMALAAVLVAAGVALAVVAARGPAPPRTMAERVRAVAATIRCPVCQDLSVADSPSRLAGQIRTEIAQKLAAGEKPDQIRADYVRVYGEFVLLSPPRRGIDLVAWAAPALLLLGGLLVAVSSIRRWTTEGSRRPAGSGPAGPQGRSSLSDEDRHLLDRALSSVGDEAE
jgi:cytochrome c-type biogenesis protein CcmH